MNTEQLTLPHTRLDQRRFVLEPLAEVAPQLHVPAVATASSLHDTLRDQAEDQAVERVDDHDAWCNVLVRNLPTIPVGK
jgi:7,8-dihydro-6-hydroxymethylpterin-pyrophosphokinase